ncbi:hypothetical protein [Intrasporangium sp. DVR]|uniref:hypothetical protein n=1 Tax=Intrasporangium sp. DVR TaxID=3127867 RepID=UPI00333EC55A
MRFDGTSWGTPTRVIPQVDGEIHAFTDVSCSSPLFCLATTTDARLAVYRSGAWKLVDSTSYWGAVDCYSSTRCALVTGLGASGEARMGFWDGTSVFVTRRVSTVASLTSVSCPSATVCVAAGVGGSKAYVARAKGTSLTVTGLGEGSGWWRAEVSCTSWSFCLMTTGGTEAWRWNGSGWRRAADVQDGIIAFIDSLSCTSTTSCIGVGGGRAARWNGSSWRIKELTSLPTPSLFDRERVIDCASSSMCIAVDGKGRQTRWNGSAWSTLRTFVTTRGLLDTLSCPSASRCMSGDFFGNILVWNGTSWSTHAAVLPSGAMVSCPTSTWCLAVSRQSGLYRTWTGSWGPKVRFDLVNHYGSLGCASTTNCFLFQGGDYRRFNGSSWSALKRLFSAQANPQLTCPSSKMCLAWDDVSGTVSRWGGTSWGAPRTIGLKRIFAVSCSSASSCLAIGSTSTGMASSRFNGWTWSVKALPGELNPNVVECQSSTSCLAAGHGGVLWRWNGSTWSKLSSTLGLEALRLECAGQWCMATSSTRAVWGT